MNLLLEDSGWGMTAGIPWSMNVQAGVGDERKTYKG